MGNIKLQPISWNRFITRGFGVKPELLGLSHNFLFQGFQITIHLPQQASYREEEERATRATVFSWRENEGDKIPLEVAIESVDVTIQSIEDVTIPKEALDNPPKLYDLFSEQQQEHLNNLASRYGTIAEEAFDLWVRTLRWKTNYGAIGRSEIQGSSSGWSTYLLDPISQKRFWAAPHIMTLSSIPSIDRTTWDKVQFALQSRLEPPVYYDLMFDAVEHIEISDLQRAVVDMAVACEAYMRKAVMQRLPQALSQNVYRYIDEANIRQVLNHFFPDTLNDDERKTLKSMNSNLQNLFNSRNTILHSGRKAGLTQEECNKYLETTRKLLALHFE